MSCVLCGISPDKGIIRDSKIYCSGCYSHFEKCPKCKTNYYFVDKCTNCSFVIKTIVCDKCDKQTSDGEMKEGIFLCKLCGPHVCCTCKEDHRRYMERAYNDPDWDPYM